MSSAAVISFTKGHGTKNDFVIIADPDDELQISPHQVSRICDRRDGIGADGLLRVVRVEHTADAVGDQRSESGSSPVWFMDYRNADGSIAAMCGNGARVFARYLVTSGLTQDRTFVIATRAGTHEAQVHDDGQVSVEMAVPRRIAVPRAPEIELAGWEFVADPWWVPNPHAVVFVDRIADLPTELSPLTIHDHGVFPDGVNVEFVEDESGAALHATMRVLERGVGETLSCGTGACAVSLAVRQRHDVGLAEPGSTVVDVLGGRLTVEHTATGRMNLIGPTELVANGTFEPTWWGRN